jgi:hypothetical protein
VLTGGPVAVSQRQGAVGRHQWDPEVAPGMEDGAGAHQRGGSTARPRNLLRAAAFYISGGASVAGDDEGAVLQLEGGRKG